MTETKKERYRQIRGVILKLLAKDHPAPLSFKELYFILDDLGFTLREEEFRSHLCYLEEKGLVKLEKRRYRGIEIEMVRITADGLNVQDGFIKDIGIDTRF